MKYRFLGKEKLLALGAYPITSLVDARAGRDDAKKLLAAGKDPMTHKREGKRLAIRNAHNTFQAVALEWYEKQCDRWSPSHVFNVMRKLERDIFPYIGARPISEIDAPEILDVLRRIEKRGSLEVEGKVKQIFGMVLRYGIATGRCTRDHSADLRGALKVAKTQHYPSLDIKELPEFLAALERNEARLFPQTQRAIKILMLTFVRTSELIKATWSEFDLENAQWEIPAERMKMGNPHIVPLSRQVVRLLKKQQEENEMLIRIGCFPAMCGLEIA